MIFLDKFIHHPLIFPSCLSLKDCNDRSLIYSFRVVVLNVGDFAPRGHLERSVDILIVTTGEKYDWHLTGGDQDAATYPTMHRMAPATQSPNPTCQQRQAEKHWFGIGPVSFTAARETALELGSSAASVLREAPPIKLL